jgi:hypothetical protein
MTGPVLREPNIRRFLLGQVTSLLGDTALAFTILDLTGSPSALGTVLSARTAALLARLLAGGVVADRFPRHKVMLAAYVVRVITQAAMAVLLLSRRAEIWELAALLATAALAVHPPATSPPQPNKEQTNMDSTHLIANCPEGSKMVVEQLNRRHARVKLPKLGWVRFRHQNALVALEALRPPTAATAA